MQDSMKLHASVSITSVNLTLWSQIYILKRSTVIFS